MSELESLASRASQLASKVDFWNSAVLWALLITALAAGAIVFSQRLAFVRAKQLSEVQDNITRIREANSEQATLQLRTDLEKETGKVAGLQTDAANAKAAQQRVETELAKQQERAAIAERNSANAQQDLLMFEITNEKTAKQLADIIFKRSQRVVNFEVFVNALKGKPKAHVDILYEREDVEAWELAGQIYRALGPGEGGSDKGAGWDVSEPIPLPFVSGNEEPAERRYGGGFGIGVVSKYPWHPRAAADTALDALMAALQLSLGDSTSASALQLPDAPDNVIRIVVGQKR